ncbi:MAG TPA: glycosyl hydrolase [Actinomycetales bacterium]|nr:glycosyl hydrolase [Actinomycetales bacterium]
MSKSSRRSVLQRTFLVVLTTLLLAGYGAGSASAKSAPVTPPPNTGFGVSMPGVPGDLSPLTSLSSALGQAPRQLMWYVAWSAKSDFPTAQAAAVAATGAVPVITWEPWNPANGVDQPAYALDRITAGDYSAYETAWAKQIKAYGKPVVLRFAHEMNGDWYPWSAQTNGNTASDYVAAWRQVRSVFSRVGVTNVSWSWSPNVPYYGSTALSALYPGDSYVDQVALDGYNWGTTQSWSTWTSFWDIFSGGVTQLRALTTKPVFVAEVASAEAGGSKAAWISDMFATLAAHPEIRGFSWFDHAKEADWRIDSSPESLDAFRTGLAGYSY